MKLIDAEALLESLEPYEDYDHIVKWIKQGSFDPPKFSAEAIEEIDNELQYLTGVISDSDEFDTPESDVEKLACHLIEYLEQLMESK